MNRHSADNNDASIVSRAAAQVQQLTPQRAQSVTIFGLRLVQAPLSTFGYLDSVKKMRVL